MAVTTEQKAKVVHDYQRAAGDTGSPEVQVALLTTRSISLEVSVSFSEGRPSRLKKLPGIRPAE